MYICFESDRDSLKEKNFRKQKVKMAQLASAALAIKTEENYINFIDVGEKCYPVTPAFDPTNFRMIVDDHFVNNFPSFTYYDKTNMICVSDKDFVSFLESAPEHIQQISQKTNQPVEVVCEHLQELAATKKVRIQPTGIANYCHKALNLGYASAAAVKPTMSVAVAHMKGVTGLAFLQANVATIFVYVPFTSAIVFATGERLAAGTRFGNTCGLMRDLCLIPTKFSELVANDLILKHLPIDIRFNVSDYLKFGTGYPLAEMMTIETAETWWGKVKEILAIIQRPRKLP